MLRREEVDKNLTWDLTALFKTEEDYLRDLDKFTEKTAQIEEQFKGKLDNAKNINDCLDNLRDLYIMQGLLGAYARLHFSVDQVDEKNQERSGNFSGISSKVDSTLSFVESEILEAKEEVLTQAINSSKENANYLKEIKEKKKHTLHKEAERVIASLSEVLDSTYKVYNMAKLGDLDFPNFKVEDKEYPLSFVLFENKLEYEVDTKVRRAAFNAFSTKLKEYQNTMAATFETEAKKEKIFANLRGFDSVFDSLLFPQKVERELYDRQIDIIMEKLAPHMRKYAKLIKRIYNLDEMTFADLKLPVDATFEPEISIEDTKERILKGLAVLGEDYTALVERAFNERWIDFVQNKGKSTGAFCSSPYGAHSFILQSWTSKMEGLFTLAHELGHAGHFYLAQKHQNIYDTRPSLYFIEAPSTMNEMLMANYMLKTSEDPRLKRWVLSSMVGKTYYHNFVTHLLEAAFQREVYKIIDAGGSLPATKLNKLKREVLEKFWGEDVKIVEGAELTWMRQPHYYMGLYPYTYSAGLTIATKVSQRILTEGQVAIDDWREVLKAGGTKTPMELAKMAGVDISTDKPLLDTIEHIGNMIDEIIELTDSMN
jgi:oligoendopeptidase F